MGLVGVAVVAGVGRAEFDGQIRSRNTEAMIVPPIDPHVGARGHMTGGAPERRARALMVVVRDRRILVGGMALPADAIIRRPKLGTMRLVAIAARDAGRKHLALLE